MRGPPAGPASIKRELKPHPCERVMHPGSNRSTRPSRRPCQCSCRVSPSRGRACQPAANGATDRAAKEPRETRTYRTEARTAVGHKQQRSPCPVPGVSRHHPHDRFCGSAGALLAIAMATREACALSVGWPSLGAGRSSGRLGAARPLRQSVRTRCLTSGWSRLSDSGRGGAYSSGASGSHESTDCRT